MLPSPATLRECEGGPSLLQGQVQRRTASEWQPASGNDSGTTSTTRTHFLDDIQREQATVHHNSKPAGRLRLAQLACSSRSSGARREERRNVDTHTHTHSYTHHSMHTLAHTSRHAHTHNGAAREGDLGHDLHPRRGTRQGGVAGSGDSQQPASSSLGRGRRHPSTRGDGAGPSQAHRDVVLGWPRAEGRRREGLRGNRGRPVPGLVKGG